MNRKTRFTVLVAIILVLALVQRLLYLWLYSASPLFSLPIGPDISEYNDWAREIIAWGTPFSKNHIHAPFYPVILALLYKIFSYKYFFVRLLQLLLGMGGIGFLACVVRRNVCVGRPLIAWLFFIVAMLYPTLIFYEAELISESLLVPLLCVSLGMLYWGEKRIYDDDYAAGITIVALGGLFAGLAVITHPMALAFAVGELLLLAITGLVRLRKQAFWKKALIPVLFFIAVMLPVSPVCYENTRIAGTFVLIQKNSGFNLYLGNNQNATGLCSVRPGPTWNLIHNWAAESAIKAGVSKDRFLIGETIDFIKKHPVQWLKLLGSKCLYVWNFRELAAGAELQPLIYYTGFMRLFRYSFVLLGIMAFSGMVLMFFSRQTLWRYRHFLVLALTFWIMQILTVVSGRYRLGMYPALFIFAAFSIDYLLRYCADSTCLVRFSGSVCLGALVVVLPRPPFNAAGEQSEADSILGEAYYKTGNYFEAERFLKQALLNSPDPARNLNLLGMIQLPYKKHSALRYFRMAVKAAPYEPEGYMNLAIELDKQGEHKAARKYFKKALILGAGKPDVLYNYGYYQEGMGDLVQAAAYYSRCLAVAPYDSRALNAMGVLMIRVRKFEDAVKYLNSAVLVSPDKPGVRLNLVVALLKLNRKYDAWKHLNVILREHPENKNALLLKKMIREEETQLD
ncbi:tetratricopeptide repeat protein [Lentisphaerota bacterium ZTH]|nr:tetratricopeptide repeat protein [Lentisphaerota bacterium]WET06112.1 tetratricopeptide repeat protein [Lentisphaerota bacterium ZTH]